MSTLPFVSFHASTLVYNTRVMGHIKVGNDVFIVKEIFGHSNL